MDITVCGNVVITDHALIVISPNPTTQARRQSAGSFAAHAVGGALGGAIAAATRPRTGSGGLLNLGDGKEVPPLLHIDRILTCWPSEVPMELRELAGWPRISEDRPVTFYPRSLMGVIALGWTGTLHVTFPGVAPDLNMSFNFWQVGKAKAHLAKAGYPLK